MIGFGFRNGLIHRIHKYVSIKKSIREKLLADLENDELLIFNDQQATTPAPFATTKKNNMSPPLNVFIPATNLVNIDIRQSEGNTTSGILSSMSNSISPDTHPSKPTNQIKSLVKPNQISFVGVSPKKSKSSSSLYNHSKPPTIFTASNSANNLTPPSSDSLKGSNSYMSSSTVSMN